MAVDERGRVRISCEESSQVGRGRQVDGPLLLLSRNSKKVSAKRMIRIIRIRIKLVMALAGAPHGGPARIPLRWHRQDDVRMSSTYGGTATFPARSNRPLRHISWKNAWQISWTKILPKKIWPERRSREANLLRTAQVVPKRRRHSHMDWRVERIGILVRDFGRLDVLRRGDVGPDMSYLTTKTRPPSTSSCASW